MFIGTSFCTGIFLLQHFCTHIFCTHLSFRHTPLPVRTFMYLLWIITQPCVIVFMYGILCICKGGNTPQTDTLPNIFTYFREKLKLFNRFVIFVNLAFYYIKLSYLVFWSKHINLHVLELIFQNFTFFNSRATRKIVKWRRNVSAKSAKILKKTNKTESDCNKTGRECVLVVFRQYSFS